MAKKLISALSGLAACILVWAPVPASFGATTTRVSHLNGEVFIGTTDKGPWQPAKKGMTISEDQYIKTGDPGRVELTMPDDSIVRLASNTLFKINQASFPEKEARRFSARLFLGKMWAKVTSRFGTPRGTFNAHTPTAVAGVRGTVYNLEVAKDTSTNIWVYEGKVGVGPPVLVEGGSKDEIAWPAEVSEKKWAEIILARLQRLHIGADGKPGKPAFFDPAQEKDEWTAWNLQRDR